MKRHIKRISRRKTPSRKTSKRNIKRNTSKRRIVYLLKQKKVKHWDKKRDSKRHALPPGKRISDTGHVYYERRSNHSDVKNSRL